VKQQTDAFQRVLTDAMADFEAHGYDSQARLQYWMGRLREAALSSMVPEHQVEDRIRKALGQIFQRLKKGGIAKYHAGVSRFTLENIAERARPELERRIRASADLIRLHRDQAIETTLRRFAGWASSIPDGSRRGVEKREAKTSIAKPLRQQSFEERRVAIDQGHKLAANINAVVAESNHAIAAEWHSHWRRKGYDYRKDHKERDGKIYVLRGNWAQQAGLMKAGPAGYLDEITQPGEEPFCRCFVRYIYNIRNLPEDMLTQKGKAYLSGPKDSHA